jgi:hypothetical protein
MKMLRVFIKPDGRCWVDLVLPADQDCTHAMGAATRENALCAPDCYVPLDSILFASTWTAMAQTKPSVVQFPWRGPEPPKEGA